MPEGAFDEQLVTYQVDDQGKGYGRVHPMGACLSISTQRTKSTDQGSEEAHKAMPDGKCDLPPKYRECKIPALLTCFVNQRIQVAILLVYILLDQEREEALP